MKARGNLSQQRRIRYYGNFSESESWSIHEDEVTGKPVAYTKVAGKPAASSMSENSGNRKAEKRNCYIISTYPLQSYLTWTKSIRL